MNKVITIIIFILVFILGAGFSAINTTPVAINFYMGSLTVPLSVLIVAAIIIGAILSAIALSISFLRLRYDNRRLHKKLESAEQEINSLRIIPVTDAH
jgi:uncharacterized integral membrane protein